MQAVIYKGRFLCTYDTLVYKELAGYHLWFYSGKPGKTIYDRRSENITMAEKQKCEYCEKEAIGYQGFGCCSAYVCLDHADNLLLALKPGEKQSFGECYLERFRTSD
jgi:hypothetical protein